MTHAELQRIRNHLAVMEGLIANAQPAAGGDDEALLEFRSLCWTVLLLADDAGCQQQIDLLVQYAKELYAGAEPHAAKRKLHLALASFRDRLTNLERGYGKRWRDLRAA
jgi:hypothetical protein